MAVRREDDVIRARHMFKKVTDQLRAFTGGSVAHGVRDVDRCRARFDRNFNGTAQIIKFGTCRIHRRPLHVVAKVARVAYGFFDPDRHFVFGQVRDRTVQRGCTDKGVNTWLRGVLHSFPAAINVTQLGAGQTADD